MYSFDKRVLTCLVIAALITVTIGAVSKSTRYFTLVHSRFTVVGSPRRSKFRRPVYLARMPPTPLHSTVISAFPSRSQLLTSYCRSIRESGT